MAETLTPKTLAANPERYHLIDVRDAEDYAAGHVEGAVHIPWPSLKPVWENSRMTVFPSPSAGWAAGVRLRPQSS